MKKYLLIVLAIPLLLSLVACSDEASGEDGDGKIVLKAANAYPPNEILAQGYYVFEEILKEKSDGRIELEYVGGPETIPPFELGEAVRTGVVDLATNAAAYYADQLPEGLALSYSELTTSEENENGAMEFLNEIHNEKMGVQLISRLSEVGFNLYTREPVESIEQMNGMRIRGTNTYRPAIETVGGEIVTMPGGEIYTALERGVIDGYGWVASGITDAGLHEHTSSIIGPSFFRADIVLMFNLDTWNDLPEDVQEIIYEAAYESEERLKEVAEEWAEKEADILAEAGVEMVDFGEEFIKEVYDRAWDWLVEYVPENGEKLRELFRK